VVCCNGAKHACSFLEDDLGNAGTPLGDKLERCVEEHEATHRGDVQDCKGQPNGSMPNWRPELGPADQQRQEVIGAQAEYDCLQRKEDECDSEPDPQRCRDCLEARMGQMALYAQQNNGQLKNKQTGQQVPPPTNPPDLSGACQ
jgi:hypothetical protein